MNRVDAWRIYTDQLREHLVATAPALPLEIHVDTDGDADTVTWTLFGPNERGERMVYGRDTTSLRVFDGAWVTERHLVKIAQARATSGPLGERLRLAQAALAQGESVHTVLLADTRARVRRETRT